MQSLEPVDRIFDIADPVGEPDGESISSLNECSGDVLLVSQVLHHLAGGIGDTPQVALGLGRIASCLGAMVGLAPLLNAD
ncbi:hypothetical protein D9M71_784650 [compost metagenome]